MAEPTSAAPGPDQVLDQALEEPMELVVPVGGEGRRLDVVALELMGDDYSRSQVQRWLKEGHITLEGGPARAADKVRPGQRIRVAPPAPVPDQLTPEPMALEILYEDQHLIAVNKAPGLVVHPAPGHATGTLVHGLMAHTGGLAQVGGRQRPGIVHRLDKDTSGAILAAKSDAAHRGLVAAFAAGRVDKEYLALVWGAPPSFGRADSAIGRHPVDRKRMSSKARHGKPALSEWRVARRFGAGLSLLRVRIHTGRTHQIRVHLTEAGYPVALDATYGGLKLRGKLPGPVASALKAAGRQMLHALAIGLDHPVTGQRLELTAPLPPDFRAVLRALEASDERG